MTNKKESTIHSSYDVTTNIKSLGLDASLIQDKEFLVFLQQFIDSIPLLIIVIKPDKNYTVVLVNKHMARSFGTTVEKIIGKSIYDFIPPGEARNQRKTYVDKAIQNKKPTKFIDRRDKRYFENYLFPNLNTSGEVIYAIAIVNEITEKKDLIKELADKEQLFSEMIHNSTDMTYILSKEGNIIYRSPSAEQLLGYDTSTIGISAFDHVHPSDRMMTKTNFNLILEHQGKSKTFTFRVKDAKGTYHVFEAVGNNQIHNPSINGIIFNCRDVTEKEQIRNELINSRQKIISQKNYLEQVIENMSDIIFTMNKKGIIKTWNHAAEKHLGYTKKDIIDKSITKLPVFQNPKFILKNIQKNPDELNQITVLTKKGTEKTLKPNISALGEISSDLLFICRDIQIPSIITGNIQDGYSYFNDDGSKKMKDIFYNITNISNKGLYITRPSINTENPYQQNNTTQLFLMDDSGDKKQSFDLETSLKNIQKFLKDTTNTRKVILLDRLDYFLVHHSFETVLKFLYNINDLIRKNQGIFLLDIKPDILNERQKKYIAIEFKKLQSKNIKDVYLDSTQYNMLLFILEQNKKNNMVNFKKITNKFDISKVTTKKHIDFLENKKLIFIEESGRTKYIYITPTGEKLLK